jgi:anti-sigma regulatory factor (Ser/Thr protein kinase)
MEGIPMAASAGPSTPKTLLPAKPVGLMELGLSSDSLVRLGGDGDPMTPIAANETERRFRFRGLPQAVGAARRVLREWESHFDPLLFYDLSLCVSELVTNRVQHGDPAGRNEIELAVRRNELLVRAETSEPRPDLLLTTPAVMKSSDWGMFIVDRVADRWGIDHSDGSRVWCEIDLASDGRSRRGPVALPLSA